MLDASAVNLDRKAGIDILVGNDGDFALGGELSLKGGGELFGGLDPQPSQG